MITPKMTSSMNIKKTQKFSNSQPKLPPFERSKHDYNRAENEFQRSIAEAELRSRSSFSKSAFGMSSMIYDDDDLFEAVSFSKSVAWGIHGGNQPSAKSFVKPENDFSRSVGGQQQIKSDNYKTTLCYQWKDKRECSYGENCRFGHGEHELKLPRTANLHYKTVLCHNFAFFGECPYGSRCNFIHRRNASPSEDIPEPELSVSSFSMTDGTSDSCPWSYGPPFFNSESSNSP